MSESNRVPLTGGSSSLSSSHELVSGMEIFESSQFHSSFSMKCTSLLMVIVSVSASVSAAFIFHLCFELPEGASKLFK
ncbi:hypothetical protein ACH5RR_010222 [Cinchona calisaya]|uniref:Uncharacterized protein n=1 Tax=Cinchona calisaya TaxID=153742 RepID=A0ABD3AGD2_9GENT